MKSAKVFLFGMYLHLFLSIAVPIIIILRDGWNGLTVALFLFYLFMIFCVGIAGWVCVIAAADAYKKGNDIFLKNGLKLLKIYSIPFYILNFAYSYIAWLSLIGASRGLMALLLPLPVCITCTMIFQSGILGCFYIKRLRKKADTSKKPHRIHYFLQILPLFDVLSSIIILKNCNSSEPAKRHL